MANDLSTFSQRYLVQWDKRATVRTMPRYRLSESAASHDFFPAALQPLATHEAVIARGKDALHELLVRSAYGWQEAIATIEVDVVTDLCGKLANQGIGVPLPDAARQVALTIGTDEVYHAYAAREFIADVHRHTGIRPEEPGQSESPIQKALAYVQREAPPELRRQAETMVLCFAEHFVTEGLFGMSKDTTSDNPFHITIREHLIDEGRHQNFFQHLMRHMWAQIDEEARAALGRLMPGFLDIFLLNMDLYTDDQVRLLGFLGFGREDSRRIIAETFMIGNSEKPASKDKVLHAQHCLSLLRIAGVLDHHPTRDVMIESGWIKP